MARPGQTLDEADRSVIRSTPHTQAAVVVRAYPASSSSRTVLSPAILNFRAEAGGTKLVMEETPHPAHGRTRRSLLSLIILEMGGSRGSRDVEPANRLVVMGPRTPTEIRERE